SLGAGFLTSLLLGLLLSTVLSTLVCFTSSLVPANGILTTALVSSSWWVYNATNGGLHMMISGSPQEFWDLIMASMAAGVTVLQFSNDWSPGIVALKALDAAWKGPGLGLQVAIFQIISLGLDLASIVLGVIGLLQQIVGEKDTLMNEIGVGLGVGGMATAAMMLQSGTVMSQTTSDFKQGLVLGEVLGLLGMTASLASFAGG